MRTLDFPSLYRATVGFDQVADLFDRVMSNDANQNSYPPYNIEKTSDDGYRISIAVAGFAEQDLSIEVKENTLFVSAKNSDEGSGATYLHRGIASRAFNRRFTLADHVRVAQARHENGMLHIDLLREVPEALKPRQIVIQSGKELQVEAAGH